MEKINIEALSLKEALQLYHECSASARKAFAISLILECFTYLTEDLIRTTIKEQLEAKGKTDLVEKGISLLTSAVEPSFIGKHHLTMLSFAEEVTEKEWKDVFQRKEAKEILNTLENNEGKYILKKIEEYQQKYFWMNNGYA